MRQEVHRAQARRARVDHDGDDGAIARYLAAGGQVEHLDRDERLDVGHQWRQPVRVSKRRPD